MGLNPALVGLHGAPVTRCNGGAGLARHMGRRPGHPNAPSTNRPMAPCGNQLVLGDMLFGDETMRDIAASGVSNPAILMRFGGRMWARILSRPQFNVFNVVVGIHWRVFIARAHSLRARPNFRGECHQGALHCV